MRSAPFDAAQRAKMADFSALADEALRTIADDDEAINLTVSDVRGLRMYVAGSSQAWNDKDGRPPRTHGAYGLAVGVGGRGGRATRSDSAAL